MSRAIHLDLHGGIAGDMFAAALLDAFPEAWKNVIADLRRVVPDAASIGTVPGLSGGLRVLRLEVPAVTTPPPPRTPEAVTAHLNGAGLPEQVLEGALAIYGHLAEAESTVHGRAVDEIHFHEVSDWDSITDVVAAASLIAAIGPAVWSVGAVPIGSGTVRTAHGLLPVPAPATAELLRGFRLVDDGIPGERVTPTGAAILRHLADPDAVCPGGRLSCTGMGAGSRDLAGRPNVLRVLVFDGAATEADVVTRISCELDDMTGEEIGFALDHLRAMDGVLDAATIAMQGKKARPVVGLRVLASSERARAVADALFDLTTTLGLRMEVTERLLLPRSVDGTVKRSKRPGGTTAKVESDALADAPTLAERRARAQAVEAESKEADIAG